MAVAARSRCAAALTLAATKRGAGAFVVRSSRPSSRWAGPYASVAVRWAFTDVGLGWGASASAIGEASGRWTPEHLQAGAAALLQADKPGAEAPGFALGVAASGIPDSGDGVFVERGVGEDGSAAIPEGTVVALYSGVFFPLVPLHARAAAKGDGIVMDVLRLAKLEGYGTVEESLVGTSYDEASSYWLILEVYSGIMDGFRAKDRVGCRSPYAVGQLINHPMRGVRPNVDWQEFRWPDEVVNECANRLHRGFWYIDPVTWELVQMPSATGQLCVPLPGVAIVATRDLAVGEELFMNYRYNPPYPSWYSPVEPLG